MENGIYYRFKFVPNSKYKIEDNMRMKMSINVKNIKINFKIWSNVLTVSVMVSVRRALFILFLLLQVLIGL